MAQSAISRTLGPVPRLQEMIEVAADIDVRDELAKVRAPTAGLPCQTRWQCAARVRPGRSPTTIPGARIVELDSANHILLGDEPAWPVFTRELRAFLRS